MEEEFVPDNVSSESDEEVCSSRDKRARTVVRQVNFLLNICWLVPVGRLFRDGTWTTCCSS